jgi:hypothetical protein
MDNVFRLLDGGLLQWNAWQIIGFTLLNRPGFCRGSIV